MKKSSRLNKIIDIATRDEQSMIRKLGLKQMEKQAEQDRLDSLIKFRNEYYSQVMANGAEGLGAKQLSQYQIFLNKMNEAIKHQEQSIQQVDQELITAKTAWAQANNKTRSYGKLMDKALTTELQEQLKREQAEIDNRCKRERQR